MKIIFRANVLKLLKLTKSFYKKKAQSNEFNLALRLKYKIELTFVIRILVFYSILFYSNELNFLLSVSCLPLHSRKRDKHTRG